MELASSLEQALGKDELDKALAAKVKEFHGLLTREVALRLVAKEKGLLKEEKRLVRAGEIEKGAKGVSIRAKVAKVWQTVTYKSGKRSKVVELEDESGTIPLVMWNDDVKVAERLRRGDELLVDSAYERNGELHLGYAGKLEVVKPAEFTPLHDLAEGRGLHFRGFVSRVEGSRSEAGRDIFSFFLSDAKNEARAVLWEHPERGQRLAPGDEAILENASVRAGEIYLGEDGRMLVRRTSAMLLGRLEEMELEKNEQTKCERVRVNVAGKVVFFDRENTLRFLGLDAAGDIALSTVIALKKAHMLNSSIAVKIREAKEGIVVER